MKSRPWGRKSEPAFTLPPSAFTLLPHRLPRPPQSNRHPAAAVIHNGLSTEKLSTSLPAGLCKTFSPSRLRTRIYKYRSPVGCSRGVYASLWKRVHAVVAPCPAPPCAGWGRAKAKADAPSRSAEPCRLCAESLCAKAECTRPTPLLPVRSPRGYLSTAEPRPLMGELPCAKAECTRQTPPLPVRSPRGNLSTAAPLPACVPNHCAQRRSAQGNPRPCPCVLPAAACLRPCTLPADGRSAVRSPRVSPPTAAPPPADGRSAVRSLRVSLPTAPPPPADGRSAERRVGEGEGKGGRPLAQCPVLARLRPRPRPPKWAPRLRWREGKRPNGAPPHHNAHTPNSARKRYLHNSRTKTQRRTKRCAQFVIFVFTPCKLLHNFSTVLHRSPRNVPKRAQIAARRSDFPCFTARSSNVLLESHRAKHPLTAPVLPPKNAPLRAYAKPRPHSRVRGTRQHATTCAFFTFSARYERVGGARNANFCPVEGRKWGRFRSQMLKNGPQTKKSTFSFGRLVI